MSAPSFLSRSRRLLQRWCIPRLDRWSGRSSVRYGTVVVLRFMHPPVGSMVRAERSSSMSLHEAAQELVRVVQKIAGQGDMLEVVPGDAARCAAVQAVDRRAREC